MALKCIPSARRLATRINMQHDARDLLPVSTFRVRVEQPQIRDDVFVVITVNTESEGAISATSGSGGGFCLDGLATGADQPNLL